MTPRDFPSTRNGFYSFSYLNPLGMWKINRLIIAFLFIVFFYKFGICEGKKEVLVLNSYHPGYSWSDGIMDGIKSVFKNTDINYDIHFEYMDTKRNAPETLFPALATLLHIKYATRHLDVVITADNNALDFVLSYRNSLFPECPVVFCGINDFADSLIAGQDRITGIVEDANIKGTFRVALTLHPNTRRIIVVHDITETGLAMVNGIRTIIPLFRDRIQFEFWEDLSIAELQNNLRALPDDCIVFLPSFFRNSEGVFLSEEEEEN